MVFFANVLGKFDNTFIVYPILSHLNFLKEFKIPPPLFLSKMSSSGSYSLNSKNCSILSLDLSDVTWSDLVERVQAYTDPIVKFINTNVEKNRHDVIRAKDDVNKCYVTDVVDIEENVWSPRF